MVIAREFPVAPQRAPQCARKRLCVFMNDLGQIDSRIDSILDQMKTATGCGDWELRFVGLRQTSPSALENAAFQPFVDPERYTEARVTNTLLRLADAHLAPQAIADAVLARSGDGIVEAILACDPDIVFICARWGASLRAILQRDFPGPILVGEHGVPHGSIHLEEAVGSKKVSIVLPTHNGITYLAQSIESCLTQTYQNLELIVVDDGSTADVQEIVGRFSDERLRFIRHQRNQGLPATLNTGFRAASGSYLTWTSDDNYYAPGAIARLARFLDRYPNIPFVYTSMYIVDGSDRPPTVRRALPSADLKRQNGVGACFMYTRQVYREIGEYNTDATLVEDYDYWVRISKRFRMQRILDPIYYYRYHDQSLTAKHTAADVARRFDTVRQQNGLPMR